MNESILYNICMLVSTMVEVYLVFDFYKAFHAKTEIFGSRVWELGLAGIVIVLNTIANLQNNSKLNFVVTCFLCFLLVWY